MNASPRMQTIRIDGNQDRLKMQVICKTKKAATSMILAAAISFQA
jgi:hypothetical protein